MNIVKRILVLSLALVLAFGCALPAMATDKTPHYNSYVALGDSIAAGSYLPGYYRGIETFLDGAYPALIKEEVGAADDASFDGARCGMRVYEMLMLLDDRYNGDDYTDEFFSTTWANPMNTAYLTNPARREAYRRAVKNADLITVNFGSNEIFGVAMFRVMKLLALADNITGTVAKIQGAVNSILTNGITCEALADLQLYLPKWEEYPNIISEVLKSIEQFKINWDVLMEDIYKLNPDVDVVAVSTYNPNVSLLDPLFESVNSYMQFGSRYCSRYAYADITELGPYVGNGGTVDGGNHPDYGGHEMIARKILATLSAFDTCAHKHTFTLGKVKALLPGTVGYSGDVYCTDCHRMIEQGKVVTFCGKDVPLVRNIGRTILGSLSNSLQKLFK